MHTFQPYPTDLLEMNPFTKIGKEWMLISSGSKKEPNTMTASWGGVGVLWNKNVVYIFVRESRYTKELIENGDFFSIAFFDEAYRDALNYCGSHSGRDGDKFADAGLTPAFRHGIPYPDEANLVLLCQKIAKVPISEDTILDPSIMKTFYKDSDMHTMYVGELIEAMAR